MATVDQQTAGPGTSSAARSTASKPATTNTIYLSMPSDTLHQPPIAIFLFGLFLVFVGIGANVWQPITTYIAFHTSIVTNPTYLKLNLQGKLGAELPVMLIGTVIAIGAQAGVLYFVFQVREEWSKKAQGTAGGSGGIFHTAVEVGQQIGLVLVWVLAGAAVDTIGDVTFIGLYTSDYMVMFFYMLFLYSISTVGLVGGFHLIQSSLVAFAKWKAYVDALRGAGRSTSSNSSSTTSR